MLSRHLALFAAAALLPTLALAQVADKPGPLDIDANKDGKISKSEFVDGMLPKVRERLSQRFDMLDSNKNGILEEAEMRGQRPMRKGGMDHGGMNHGGMMQPAPTPQ